MEKKFYDIADICVVCGKPSLPGDMLCWGCRKNTNKDEKWQIQLAGEATIDAVNTNAQSKHHFRKGPILTGEQNPSYPRARKLFIILRANRPV